MVNDIYYLDHPYAKIQKNLRPNIYLVSWVIRRKVSIRIIVNNLKTLD